VRRLALGLLAICAVAPHAAAHNIKPDRELVIQFDARGGVAMWQVTIGGPQAVVMLAAADLDHDGRLSEGERVALAVSLLSKAVRGVALSWDDAPLAQAELKPRLDAGDRTLTARGLVELKLPEGCGTHRLGVALEARVPPLGVDVQAISGWRLEGVSIGGVAEGAHLTAAVALAPGDHLEVRVAARCEPAVPR